MKKTIGILSAMVLAVALFVNTNAINRTSPNISLAELFAMNNANAEVVATDSEGGQIVICDTSTSSCSYILGGLTFTVTKNSTHKEPLPITPPYQG